MKSTKDNFFGFTFSSFILFFFFVTFIASNSILLFAKLYKVYSNNIFILIIANIGNLIFCSLLLTFLDLFRRKIFIGNPINKILEATRQITSGNFDIKLEISHPYNKYNEYDIIMENLNIMAQELSKNEVLKSDFISNVSHEIKTPLAIIQNYATLISNNNLDKEKQKEYVFNLIQATKRLNNLIGNILKLNKLENQKILPKLENMDLAEALRLSILTFEDLIDNKEIDLDCDIDDVDILSYEGYWDIVFNNLISNAIKFTPKKGKISISLKQDNNFAIIKIKDTGCGISNEVGKHIFDKFYQGDTSHSGEGNGLGLALVKKVIDILGGEIFVESTIGVGSTFTIKLKKD